MPSASPMYTFSSVFTEPETPYVLNEDGSNMDTNTTTISHSSINNSRINISNSANSSNINNNNNSTMYCMDIKNGNLINTGSGVTSGLNGSSTSVYDPFKCLSAMAEQSLTGNFTHSSSSLSSIADSSICTGRGSIGPVCSSNSSSSIANNSSSSSSSSNSSNNNMFMNVEQHHPYQSCDRSMYSSLSSTSSLSSSSPPLSPASSTSCMYTSNQATPTEFLTNDNSSNFQKIPSSNQNHSQDFFQNDSPFCQSPVANHNSGGGISHARTIKKSFPSCSSDQIKEENDQLLSWTMQHPENWSNSELLDWLFFVAQDRGLDMQEFRGENFQGLTGTQLCQMSQDDFNRLEPKYGRIIYEMLRKLLCGVLFRGPDESEQLQSPCVPMSSYSPSCSPKSSPGGQAYHAPPPSYHISGTEMGHCNGVAPNMFFKQERCSNMDAGSIDINSYDFDLDDTPCITTSQCQDQYQPEFGMYPAQYPQATPIRTSCCFPAPPFPAQLPRRRPGRPRVKSLMDDDRSNKDKKVKNQHLWEFIYETLMNPMYNPQYLRWENQRDGVFRFVQSEAVAQLWGGRKNNENMTYEKLSRAMRHYYRRGILERVEGRRLVYKFSIKAMERVREKRNSV